MKNVPADQQEMILTMLEKKPELFEKIAKETNGLKSGEMLTKTTQYKDRARIFIGKIPVMVRSQFCQLRNISDKEIVKNAKECTFDQGGYFIINGGEKVIIA